MAVTTRRDGSTLLVTLDNPPVNAIGHAMRASLMAAVETANDDKSIERVIVTGAGRAFAAGADAREFDAAPIEPHLPEVLDRIEACRVPWIAAVGGVALGGGLEIALACRYRIAAPGAQLGLPEVNLGVIPGAGGTQRLPRLVGLAAALDMIPTGRPVSARKALDVGLIHEIAEDVIFAAEEVNGELLSTIPALCDLPGPAPDGEALAAARALAGRKMKNQIAPQKAIDLVEAACSESFVAAMALERQTFIELRQGAQARALRHIFFAERAAKAPDWLKEARPLPLDHAVVVGGGTMGAAISYALLNAGLRVTLIETDEDGVARARANVDKIVEASLARGLIDPAGAEARLGRLTATTDYTAAAGATLAIEAAFESMEVKQAVFQALEAALAPDTVLASNTSYLDIDEIASVLKDPARLIGLHFFAPAHIMKLLEIVRGRASSDTALATGFALGKRLGKIPVLAGVCDGFIGNRIFARYREACDTMLMDGALPWEIDAAMTGFGYAMGLYATADLSGLDIGYATRRRQDATRDPARRYIPIADRVVEAGRLGRKTGSGWYDYASGKPAPDPWTEDLILSEAEKAGVTRRAFAPEEIQRRALLAMINEAADILAEGIAQSARDIDVVTVHGYGFPRWRGGLLHYADTLGVGRVVSELQDLAGEDPVAWKASPVLEACARGNTPIAGYRTAG